MLQRMQFVTREKSKNFLTTCLPFSFCTPQETILESKKKKHKMKELSIPRELMKLVLIKSVSAPSHITVNYLHFALVSMETEIFDNFQSKPHLNDSVVAL